MMIDSNESRKDTGWNLSEEFNPAMMETSTAHLLSQISFLHNEIERLENQMNAIRLKAMNETKEMSHHYEHIIEQKDAEITEWRARLGHRKNENDLSKRCTTLEKQLAAANAEKATILMEKNDLQSKVRKLESTLKTRTNELKEASRLSKEEHSLVNDQNLKLSQIIKTLSDQNKKLTQQLASITQKRALAEDKQTQSDSLQLNDFAAQVRVLELEKECQVESSFFLLDPESQTMHSLCSSLERKTQECDEFRARLEDMKALQEDTLLKLETVSKRLIDEIEQRKLVSDDAEKLSTQVQSLQQKYSCQAATERDLLEKINILEDQKRQLRAEVVRLEHDRGTREKELKQYEKDIEELVSNKNYSNHQLNQLSNENEGLRAEIENLLSRESQLVFSFKAKEAEVHEVLTAYQESVKKNDDILGDRRFLESELDDLRATLASKEESLIFFQEQLSALHQREQQLVLDLQSFEYENDQLHRKIIHNDALAAQLETKCRELQQLLNAKDRSIEELHQSLAQLSKQIIIKENESLLLRRQCDSLESQVTNLEAMVATETQRNHKIEEANARLVARDVLSSCNYYDNFSTEMNVLKQNLASRNQELSQLQAKLSEEAEAREKLSKELQTTKSDLSVITESKERLERIVLDQTNTLSMLSK